MLVDTFGFLLNLNRGDTSWKIFKQTTTVDLMAKVKYITTSDVTNEVVWLKKFIMDLNIIPIIIDLVALLCGRNNAIMQAKEPRCHQNLKNILRHLHLIREIITKDDVAIDRVLSTKNIIYLLTKPLAQEVFERHCEYMGLISKGDWF